MLFRWERLGDRTVAGLTSLRTVLYDGTPHTRAELYALEGHDLAERTIDNMLWRLRHEGYVAFRKGGPVRLTEQGFALWPV